MILEIIPFFLRSQLKTELVDFLSTVFKLRTFLNTYRKAPEARFNRGNEKKIIV